MVSSWNIYGFSKHNGNILIRREKHEKKEDHMREKIETESKVTMGHWLLCTNHHQKQEKTGNEIPIAFGGNGGYLYFMFLPSTILKEEMTYCFKSPHLW